MLGSKTILMVKEKFGVLNKLTIDQILFFSNTFEIAGRRDMGL